MQSISDNTVPVVTIDGPGGSGKGTVTQMLARRLGWHLLDSGALYRLTALAAQRKGFPWMTRLAWSMWPVPLM